MSRSSYSDDFGDDFPGEINLFRANVHRSMRSKAGQARLRELRDALLALPVKELHQSIFAEGTIDAPKVCALGAWALAKAGSPDAARAMVPVDADDYDTYDGLKAHGWPRLVVLDAVFENDDERLVYETVEGPERHQWSSFPVQYSRPETPAERYQRVLKWVEDRIAGRSQE